MTLSVSDIDNSITCGSFISATSSNTTLLPNANIVRGGSAPGCTLTLTPATSQTGTATVIVTASDGALSFVQTFILTVNPTIVTVSQYSGYKGWSNGTFAKICSEYKTPPFDSYQYSGSTGDGIYRIDPDGAGGISPFDVYCDMTYQDGGWTLIVRAVAGSYGHRDTNAVGSVSGPLSGAAYKLSDAVINSLQFSIYRMQTDNRTYISYFDTSDTFKSTTTMGARSKPTYLGITWYGPFYDVNHVGLNNWQQGVGKYGNQTNGANAAYTDAGTSGCRLGLGMEGGASWCGNGTSGSVWVGTEPANRSIPATPTNIGITNYGSYRAWSNGTFARVCSEYLNPPLGYQYAGATGNGVYRIDPDGAGAIAPGDVTCEMTTGGWTVIKPTNPNGFNSTSFNTNTSTSIHCNGYIGCVGGYGGGYWGPGVRHSYSGSGISVVFSMTSSFAAAVYNLSSSRQVKWWLFGGEGHTGCSLNFSGNTYPKINEWYVTTNAFTSATSYSFSASTSCSGNPYFYYVTSELRYSSTPTCATNTVPRSACLEGGIYLGSYGGFKYMATTAAHEYKGGGVWNDARVHCDNLVALGYSDWYMPSHGEYVNLLQPYYQELGLINGWYWTSTQCSQFGWSGAWSMTPGTSYPDNHCSGGFCCQNVNYSHGSPTRCVRRW